MIYCTIKCTILKNVFISTRFDIAFSKKQQHKERNYVLKKRISDQEMPAHIYNKADKKITYEAIWDTKRTNRVICTKTSKLDNCHLKYIFIYKSTQINTYVKLTKPVT